MTHTVIDVADHKGSTAPSVQGDEYVVLKSLNIDNWANREETGTMTFAPESGSGNADATVTLDAGGTGWLTKFEVGEYVVITGSTHSANNDTWRLQKVEGDKLTIEGNFTADNNKASVSIKARDERVSAVDLGLSTITTLEVLGMESLTHDVRMLLHTDGLNVLTGADDKVLLYGKTTSSGAVIANDADIGTVRIRATGLL